MAARYDRALEQQDYETLTSLFDPHAVCEIKPAGLRIGSVDRIIEMFRLTSADLAASFQGRRKLREWWNQRGLVREWDYPMTLPSGEEVFAKQLEIFEFSEQLDSVSSYRLRMNFAYSDQFVAALGKDFVSLADVSRIPG